MSPQTLAQMTAICLRNGGWSEDQMVRRIRRALGPAVKGSKWPRKLVRRLLESDKFDWDLVDNTEAFADYVLSDPDFIADVCETVVVDYDFDVSKSVPAQMTPASVAANWDVPAITTSRELADWFALSIPHLDWLADCRGLERFAETEQLRNYRYRWISKRSGGQRLVESPKARLKSVQRQILDGIVSRIPVHGAAHAFRPGRSVHTFCKPHVGQDVVLRIDLRDFFPSIRASRVHGVFQMAGYPKTVTRLLTGLCTNQTYRGVLDPVGGRTFETAHLPQGAPTSPALSNLCAWHLDCRLVGLARQFGAKYTRYADDLVFSGNRRFGKQLSRFRTLVYAIALAEGFSIRNRKTRVMPKSQRQSVGGLVVNQRVGVGRAEFDRLKAILTNCVRHGLESQNRDGHPRFLLHLRGRVAYVASVNRRQGEKLTALLEAIE